MTNTRFNKYMGSRGLSRYCSCPTGRKTRTCASSNTTGTTDLSFLRHAHTHFGAQPASYSVNTGLFKMIVGVQLSSGNSTPNSGNNHHLTIPFEGDMHSFKREGACVSRNWRYESEPPLKPSPLTCYKQFGTNSIIVLMFVESQRVHI